VFRNGGYSQTIQSQSNVPVKMMKASDVLIVGSLTLLLSACGSMDLRNLARGTPPPAAIDRPDISLAELDRRLAELESMKPGLTRMVAIESDIKSLIGELSVLADDYGGGPVIKAVEEKSDEDVFLSPETLLAMAEGGDVPKVTPAPLQAHASASAAQPVSRATSQKPAPGNPVARFVTARASSSECAGVDCPSATNNAQGFAVNAGVKLRH
jgi:hypothetical protein